MDVTRDVRGDSKKKEGIASDARVVNTDQFL